MHPVYELKIVLWQQIYWDICHKTFAVLHTRVKFADSLQIMGVLVLDPFYRLKPGAHDANLVVRLNRYVRGINF